MLPHISLMRDSFAERGDREGVQDADRLLELVTHILVLAQIEAMPSFIMKRFSLSYTVRSAVALYSDTFDEKGVRLLSALEDDQVDIFGSEPLVQSAVTNLLSNAVKFAPPGSTVTVKVERKNDQIELSVQDEGPSCIERKTRRGRRKRFRIAICTDGCNSSRRKACSDKY